MGFAKLHLAMLKRVEAVYGRASITSPQSSSIDAVLDRRGAWDAMVAPSAEFLARRNAIIERQAAGDDIEPMAANDNQPTLKAKKARKPKRQTGRISFADQLQALLVAHTTPDSDPDPLASNWRAAPDGALYDQTEAGTWFTEQLLEITPSIAQIVREVEFGEIEYGELSKPLEGRPEPKHRPVLKIGKLHFSDGHQFERAVKVVQGEAIEYERLMELGAMINSSERLTVAAGGSTAPAKVVIDNSAVAVRLGVKPVSFKPGRRDRRTGRSLTSAQSQALIDQAFANTAKLPSVTKCSPGVASGTAQFSDQFIGMKVGSTGKGGAPRWVDICTALEDRNAFRKAHDSLSDKNKAVIAAVSHARSFRDVGIAAGQTCGYADKRSGGRRALIAANDNLALAIRKIAAA